MVQFLAMKHYTDSYVRVFVLLLTLGCEQPKQETAVAVLDQAKPITRKVTQSINSSSNVTDAATSQQSRGAGISLEWDERDFGTIWDFRVRDNNISVHKQWEQNTCFE